MNIKEEHHLDALNNKHRILDQQIKAYEAQPSIDHVIIHNLKKEKLAIKDEIAAFTKQISN